MAVCRTHFTPEGYPKGTVCRICSPLLHLSSATCLCLASDLTSHPRTSRLNQIISVSGQLLPHFDINVHGLQGSFADVPEAVWMSTHSFVRSQLFVERIPGDASIWYAADMSKPVESALLVNMLWMSGRAIHTSSHSAPRIATSWSSLNRLRTETGRCKALMQKWGYRCTTKMDRQHANVGMNRQRNTCWSAPSCHNPVGPRHFFSVHAFG